MAYQWLMKGCGSSNVHGDVGSEVEAGPSDHEDLDEVLEAVGVALERVLGEGGGGPTHVARRPNHLHCKPHPQPSIHFK